MKKTCYSIKYSHGESLSRNICIVDGLLRFITVGGILTFTVLAPGVVQILDKPLAGLSRKLDERQRQREYQRHLRYMKRQGLIKYLSDDYENGIQLTLKGKKRAEKAQINDLCVVQPKTWDQKWHVIMFDIPEKRKVQRDNFSRRLRGLGLVQLQRSVWVYPFYCRQEIEVLTRLFGLSRFVTYIQTDHIDASRKLKERFNFKF